MTENADTAACINRCPEPSSASATGMLDFLQECVGRCHGIGMDILGSSTEASWEEGACSSFSTVGECISNPSVLPLSGRLFLATCRGLPLAAVVAPAVLTLRVVEVE